ncbi:MAG: hypothetical protein M1587_03090 [Thaumarchaeota archaeon]|nr:hypothetical protein [Nitrososphaerota archaeon]MDG6906396.1 hypothetical protein [Nitrososphaerota archaeon]
MADKINQENSVLLLENAFVRERFDWQVWDLRQIKVSIALMQGIVEKTEWSEKMVSASNKLKEALGELMKIANEKDATRVAAGHTHVEQALSDLRSLVFGI